MDYLEFISMLGKAPDSQLDKILSKECREFSGDDPVRFLRNLQDRCVYFSGSSEFVIKAIDLLLNKEIESDPEKQNRRTDLNEKLGIQNN
jgi:hypothetical protein